MRTVSSEHRRDYVGLITNTDVWADFRLRPDDVIVSTPPKCGTTWMLNIVMMLIHGRVVPEAGNRDAAPWLDCAFRDRPATAALLDSLKRRRCIKSHTPLDGVGYAHEPAYVVVYRHPVDVHFSLRTHVGNMKDDFMRFLFPDDIGAGFRRFVQNPLTDSGTDDLTVASIAHHYLESKARRRNGNVHFFHYADMTRDLSGQIARLAGILDIDVGPALLAEMTEANTFASMRKQAEESAERFSEASPFRDQADFFASGASNKWEDKLSDDDMRAYDARIAELLPAEDVAWLNWGDRRAP